MKAERLTMIRQMLDQNPDDPFLKYAAALEYKKAGNINECIALMQKLIIEHEDYLPVYFQYGKLLEEKGTIQEAILIYKKGCDLAEKQNEIKTLRELKEALVLLED